jgi:hypothetical protein
MKKTLLFVVSMFFFVLGFAQIDEEEKKTYTTSKINGSAPKIDGFINDKIWESVAWGGGDFTQRQPNDGGPPTEQTKFKILYDDKNLYVAFKCYDADPENIVARLSRRDGFEGDRVAVMFDSYYDKRTAFSFTATAAGVKGEEYVSNNGDNWDDKWDPIWYLMTSIDEEGWVAEIKIPLSQLRFAYKPEHVWGLQLSRYYFRNDEWSTWQYVPQNAAGWVHLFGEINGINGIKPQKQIEIQPYVVAKTESFRREEGNPYATGKDSNMTMGLDAKIGITSDVTLDLTLNPDFGQVEADPSQVNLTAFQLFFPEQRPFFIEGSNILTFSTNRDVDNLFYSRRIGRKPQGGIDTDSDDLDGDGNNDDDGVAEYVDRRSNTRILGSMKLTGKNKNGFSWGVLESITRKESAEIDSLGYKRTEVIEPSTNYLIGRVQQDINNGETIIGGMVTATNRSDLNGIKHLANEAYSAGLDFTHYWRQRKYFLSGKFAASQVKGTETAIQNLQESSTRYYQRTDNDYKDVDLSKRKLEGSSGALNFGKASGTFLYTIGSTWSSPGLELNDIGFLNQTDRISQWAFGQYRKLQPFGIFRSMRLNINQSQEWDFGGNLLLRDFNFNGQLRFKNFFGLGSGSNVKLHSVSNADLRGGPSIQYPKSYSQWIWAGTDPRKKIKLEVNPWLSWSENDFSGSKGWWTRLTLRPSNALNIDFTGSISKRYNEMQYVSTQEINSETKYFMGRLDQKTYNVSMRVTYVVTPNLSVQYWGQPFASSGAFSNLKLVNNPSAEKYENRLTTLNSALNEETGQIDIDENKDGNTDYSIDNPDFNFTQFQSNMVMRWEYKPGSALFLVWTQNISEQPSIDRHSFDHLYTSLFDRTPRNTFLLKYTYRFVL